MRILELNRQGATLTLEPDELTALSNILYNYGECVKKGMVPDHSADGSDMAVYHNIAGQIILASNVGRYGQMDSFALQCYVRHMAAVYKNDKSLQALLSCAWNNPPETELTLLDTVPASPRASVAENKDTCSNNGSQQKDNPAEPLENNPREPQDGGTEKPKQRNQHIPEPKRPPIF